MSIHEPGKGVVFGGIVLAELALCLVLLGADRWQPVIDERRTGTGFAEPPPCALVERQLVARLIGHNIGQLTESLYREDDDPTRRCTIKDPGDVVPVVEVTMRARRIGPTGPPEIRSPGYSGLTITGNLSMPEPKRTANSVAVTFTLDDNLDILVSYVAPATGQALPAASDAKRIRRDTAALAQHLVSALLHAR